jgi:hypothetical protein
VSFVYIAGPYRGKDATEHNWEVYHNIDSHINEAHRWATRLARDGVYYFAPHLNSAHMEITAPDVTANFWIGMDFAILEHAWGLFLLPGWRDSEGARAEKEYAIEHKKPVFTHTMYSAMLHYWRGHVEEEALCPT